VSFLLALVTAARAYELPRADVAMLLRILGRRFTKAPLAFLVPVREEERGAAPPPPRDAA
jgi:site-specific recombinase